MHVLPPLYLIRDMAFVTGGTPGDQSSANLVISVDSGTTPLRNESAQDERNQNPNQG